MLRRVQERWKGLLNIIYCRIVDISKPRRDLGICSDEFLSRRIIKSSSRLLDLLEIRQFTRTKILINLKMNLDYYVPMEQF